MAIENSIGELDTIGGEGHPAEGSASLMPGDVLAEYKVLRMLGVGGMGEVYEVVHTALLRNFAIKVLPIAAARRDLSIERFRREARVMANLDHPNIIRVDDFGEADGLFWLRMELAEGMPLADARLPDERAVVNLQDLAKARGGKIPQRELLPLMQEVLKGLAYAHDRGTIHRDLKPSNILLQTDRSRRKPGQVIAKIADFGLVKLVDEEWEVSQVRLCEHDSLSVGERGTIDREMDIESGLTGTKRVLGTLDYMSPEQKKGGDIDARSDLYAVGVMVYRLLTGCGLGPKPVSRIDPNLVSDWDLFIEKCLEEYPDDRFPDAAEAYLVLSRMAKQIGIQPSSKPAPASRRRRSLSNGKRGPVATCATDIQKEEKKRLLRIPPGEPTSYHLKQWGEYQKKYPSDPDAARFISIYRSKTEQVEASIGAGAGWGGKALAYTLVIGHAMLIAGILGMHTNRFHPSGWTEMLAENELTFSLLALLLMSMVGIGYARTIKSCHQAGERYSLLVSMIALITALCVAWGLGAKRDALVWGAIMVMCISRLCSLAHARFWRRALIDAQYDIVRASAAILIIGLLINWGAVYNASPIPLYYGFYVLAATITFQTLNLLKYDPPHEHGRMGDGKRLNVAQQLLSLAMNGLLWSIGLMVWPVTATTGIDHRYGIALISAAARTVIILLSLLLFAQGAMALTTVSESIIHQIVLSVPVVLAFSLLLPWPRRCHTFLMRVCVGQTLLGMRPYALKRKQLGVL
jgi:serine/threonine protein kinase